METQINVELFRPKLTPEAVPLPRLEPAQAQG